MAARSRGLGCCWILLDVWPLYYPTPPGLEAKEEEKEVEEEEEEEEEEEKELLRAAADGTFFFSRSFLSQLEECASSFILRRAYRVCFYRVSDRIATVDAFERDLQKVF